MDEEIKVDYTMALRQYHQFGHGRSMRKFCEDEGYDYEKFCRTSRRGLKELDIQVKKLSEKKSAPGFIALEVEDSPVKQNSIADIRIRFVSGLELILQGSSKEEMLNVIKAL